MTYAMNRAAWLLLALAVLVGIMGFFAVLAFAQSSEEIEAVVGAITGDLALAGLALSAIVVMVVGLIRRFTGLDGRKVQWVVLGVSVLAVAVYNLIEGQMPFGAAVLAALAVFVGAIGEHEVVGKWLRQLITGEVGKLS